MLLSRCTIRECAKHVGISKSAVHYDIHNIIKYDYPLSYELILSILRYNKHHPKNN